MRVLEPTVGSHAHTAERERRYTKYAMRLIDSGNAYYAFDTAEDLDALRKAKEAGGDFHTTLRTVIAVQLPDLVGCR